MPARDDAFARLHPAGDDQLTIVDLADLHRARADAACLGVEQIDEALVGADVEHRAGRDGEAVVTRRRPPREIAQCRSGPIADAAIGGQRHGHLERARPGCGARVDLADRALDAPSGSAREP